MKITILTLFPEMFEGFLNTSIIHRAILKGLVKIELIDFRAYSWDKHHKVDDTPYGGAPGMVLAIQPLYSALKELKKDNSLVYLITPEGKTFDQKMAHELSDKSKSSDLIFICGHYEGFDARIEKYIDDKISLGDFIITGGELAAMCISDAIIRLTDGVIKKESSNDESFENILLEPPQYTMPEEFDGQKVPEVLISGNHALIKKWRIEQSCLRTQKERPDLWEKYERKLKDSEKKDR